MKIRSVIILSLLTSCLCACIESTTNNMNSATNDSIYNKPVTANIDSPISKPRVPLSDTLKIDSSSKKISLKDPTIKNNDPQNLLEYIKGFCEWDFRNTRQQLIDDGSEFHYRVSEISTSGSILKYKATIPDEQGEFEYTCIPSTGETRISFVGDKEIADFFYKGFKSLMKNATCNTVDNHETCVSDEKFDSRPLKSHFNISIIRSDNFSTILFFRQIVPL